jgi:hypothetical protein
MIKLPSQQFEYTLVYSGDPALDLPSDAPARDKALEVARDTGQWATITRGGEQPTLFHVRPIVGTLLDWLAGEIQRRELSGPEAAVLALRLALRKVEGFGDHEVKTERADARSPALATFKIIDALYAIDGAGREIVQELGDLVLLRAFGGLRPKS